MLYPCGKPKVKLQLPLLQLINLRPVSGENPTDLLPTRHPSEGQNKAQPGRCVDIAALAAARRRLKTAAKSVILHVWGARQPISRREQRRRLFKIGPV
ncbi:hypothetical protein SKAU_G00037390 [Synaphobranchus kaupii]|uniref:Uncharacterized protein n=1 Tax=Synaphobranchus kaupii TaxID=118154 RepID=A0A9Q1JDT4_SYNKA|nr:hypothetical protein SKAU_G00037390 [Synaphobranchus kaupii]